MHYLPSSEKLQEQQHFLCPDRLLLHIHTVVAFLSMLLLLAGGSTSNLQADYVLVGSYLDFLAVDLPVHNCCAPCLPQLNLCYVQVALV
jgi:hypothetical protein